MEHDNHDTMDSNHEDRITRRQALWEQLVSAERRMTAPELGVVAGGIDGGDGRTGLAVPEPTVPDQAARVTDLAADLRRLNHEATA